MSAPPPPDRPTKQLRRARPEQAPAPVVERVAAPERVVAPAVDPNVILLRLEGAVEALRTWLLVVGLVAVAALAIAIYAVATGDTSSNGGGSTIGLARDDRVTQLETRIDKLGRQVQDLRAGSGSGNDTSALASRIDALENAVKSLSGQPAAGGTQAAIDELSKRIDDLATEVEQLKQTAP